jgi:polyribonucleotide nucleotidyltransferase
MGEMMKTISEPREDYKEFVPRMVQIRVAGEFIGAIIGKGGETIQRIQRETGTTVTITESNENGVSEGIVDIFGENKESMDKAIDWINGITAVPEVGTTYKGKIVSILEFGAFVEILPGKEGLLHVSEIDWKKTEKVEDVLNIGDEVEVKLLEIDAKSGKMRLSRKALLEKPEGYVEPERKPRGDRGDRAPRRDDRRGNDRGQRRDDRRGNDRGQRRDFRKPEAPIEETQNNEPEMF